MCIAFDLRFRRPPWTACRGSWKPVEALLGVSWGPLGASWGLLGASWAPLRTEYPLEDDFRQNFDNFRGAMLGRFNFKNRVFQGPKRGPKIKSIFDRFRDRFWNDFETLE